MNLTNINETPIHKVFDEVCEKAQKRGVRVTGSELVGLIPLKSMVDAGKYFLIKQQRSIGISEKEIIKIAIKSMGLNEISLFEPNEKIIEYKIKSKDSKLVNLGLSTFLQETASESPAPGGGSISAYVGALGASLTTMVANLSSHKRGWDDRWKEFSDLAELGQKFIVKLEKLVDDDTNAFNMILNAFRIKADTEDEKIEKESKIQSATLNAIKIPLSIMENSYNLMNLIAKLVKKGNPNSVSDVGVAVLCARAAVLGGYLNVMINIKDLKDVKLKSSMIERAEELKLLSMESEKKILKDVIKTINN